LWFDGHFGIGVGTWCSIVNVMLLGCYIFGCHSLRHLIGGTLDRVSEAPDAQKALRLRFLPERRHMKWAWFSLFWVGFTDSTSGCAPWASGTTGEFLMAEYQTFYDVLVIGAGGAGCARRSKPRRPASKSGVVCKSLLGKAHTVMAEGGMAAAMGNVDDRDNWKVHFADTMRGGQYLNNWRMAELHAKEAPDRVRELEAWGAVFDRTPTAASCSATSAATAIRAWRTWATAPASR
jgi:hypothetical protein